MGNTQREEQILKEGLAILVRECAPQRVYLFGSRAKRQAQPGSDFDFAVEGTVPNIVQKTKIRDLLEAIAGLYSTNIVYLSEVDEGFRKIVLETGELLYEQK